MATDLRLIAPNRPGMLVQVFELLASADVNVEGTCADIRPGETWGYLHVLVDDADRATRALADGGFEIAACHEIEVVELEGSSRALLDTFRRYRETEQNIEVMYMAGHAIVVGTEAMRKEIPGVRVEDAP